MQPFVIVTNFLTNGAAIIVCGRTFLYGGCLLVMFWNCLSIKPKQRAINSLWCEMLTIAVLFHVMTEGNFFVWCCYRAVWGLWEVRLVTAVRHV
jgi:hypothetical protein